MATLILLLVVLVQGLVACTSAADPSHLATGYCPVNCSAGEGQSLYDLGREVRQLVLWRLRHPELHEGLSLETSCEEALALLPGMDLTGRYASYQYLARGAYRTCFCDGFSEPYPTHPLDTDRHE